LGGFNAPINRQATAMTSKKTRIFRKTYLF